jgi:hypothetical protein
VRVVSIQRWSVWLDKTTPGRHLLVTEVDDEVVRPPGQAAASPDRAADHTPHPGAHTPGGDTAAAATDPGEVAR